MTSNGGSTHVKPAHARQNTRSKVAVISLTSQGSEGGVPWSVMSLLYLPRLFAENERISLLALANEIPPVTGFKQQLEVPFYEPGIGRRPCRFRYSAVNFVSGC